MGTTLVFYWKKTSDTTWLVLIRYLGKKYDMEPRDRGVIGVFVTTPDDALDPVTFRTLFLACLELLFEQLKV